MKFSPPGLVRADAQPDVVMMVCTSGHVDHGKTLLVKFLTGCSTDRLREEQERGMTIDLGFAPCLLSNDICIGIVDVPGHERFIRNMVAGVSGIDMTILVVAADDGIMPQTFEHLQIMKLLGVRHGMVALTKIDLVEPAVVEQRKAEIRAFLAGSFMADARICPVSSVTCEGFDEFYRTLVTEIEGLRKRMRGGVFRMPVERTFKHPGYGCVVTGIPVGGQVRVGDEVELMPGGIRGRVRGLQSFLKDKPVGGYGQCLALNIPDFSRTELQRGQVLGAPGYLRPACFFHVRLTTLDGIGAPLKNAEEITFHTGTVEQHGKIYLLEERELGPMSSAIATVALATPVVAAVDDRYVIRRPSPPATVGGGDILAISREAARPMRRVALELAREYETAMGAVDKASPEGLSRRIEYELRHAGAQAIGTDEIAHRAFQPVSPVAEGLAKLEAGGRAVALGGAKFLHGDVHAACVAAARARIGKALAEKSLSLPLAALREELGWSPAVANRIFRDLAAQGVVTISADRLVLARADDGFTESERGLLRRLLSLYELGEFKSPNPQELPALLAAPEKDVRRMLEHLINQKQLVRLSPAVVLCYTSFRQAQDLVVKIIREEGSLDSGNFRDRIGTSRKYAIAILDFLDQRHVTVRNESTRILTAEYEKRLM